MFPQGGPGIALLLLRVSVGGALLLDAWPRFVGIFHHWTLFFLILVLLSLLLGFLTPVLALLCFVLEITGLFISGVSDARAVLFPLQAASLVLLGPGAYSLDARLFGRRILVLSPKKSSRNL